MVLAAVLVAYALVFGPASASARLIEKYSPGAHVAAHAHKAKPAAHATSAAATGEPSPGGKGSAEESVGSTMSSEGDPLSENGLQSPFCRNPGVLSAAAQRNCETSHFVAASDPTGNYAFDVNINTGIEHWSNDISATIENFLQFGWIALVALVHGILVMLEWCYSPGLISSATMEQAAHALHETQLTFTRPWMVFVLSIASMFALYHGLIRRRVAETLGQVLMMLAMMVGGLWVIADPAGTVGVIGEWANSSSLGTLDAVTASSPESGERTLAEQMQNVFATVVTGPWCYLEFGNEKWCHQPEERDKKLAAAAMKIANEEKEQSKCGSSCGPGASLEDRDLAMSARLLMSARNNGELFLALPANQLQRNSVTTEGSLLNVLCGESEAADKCTGETAPEAEFRSERGTGGRVIGLILIWVGGLGMLLLFGFLAFRLLEAAIASLLYLLLAPAAVLAPALGDGGRAAFRAWGMRLLGAFVAKLIYSFLLGVILLMMHMLTAVTVLGWWAQWLLMSALWWVALHHRHKILGFAQGAPHQGSETGSMRWYYRVRMAQDVGRAAGWARKKLASPPASTNRSRQVPLPPNERSGSTGSQAPLAPVTGVSRAPRETDRDSLGKAASENVAEAQNPPERDAPEVMQTPEDREAHTPPDTDPERRFADSEADDDDFDEHITPPPDPGRRFREAPDAPDEDDLQSSESPVKGTRVSTAALTDAQPAVTPPPAAAKPAEPRLPQRDRNDQQSDTGSSPQQRPIAPTTKDQPTAGPHESPASGAEEAPTPVSRSTPEGPTPPPGGRDRAPGSRGPGDRTPVPARPAGKPGRPTRVNGEHQRSSRRAHDETPYEKLARQLSHHEKRASPRRKTNIPPPGRNR